MAAPLGFKTFATGDVLTAADTNGYLMQGVWVFASAAARDAAVTSPQEGNFCYLKDTNVTQYYTGSAWAAVGGSTPTFVGANATKTANQSLANVTVTSISFEGTDILDSNGFHDPSTNNTRMTIPTGYAGKYLIQGTLEFASNTTGGREVYIRKNGSTNLQAIQTDAEGSLTMTISGTFDLAVGDYVEIRAYQSSGGSLDVWATNSGYGNCSSFQVTYLGA
jgi:hypothetical protein